MPLYKACITNLFSGLRFGLQTKVVFITVLTGILVGGLLTSFQIDQNRTRAIEIAKDRLRHDGSIVQQEILERGDKASEISKKIAITLQLFEKLDSKTIQQVISSFQNKNPGYKIQIRTMEEFLTRNPAEENFSNPEDRPTVFSALKGESTVSIENPNAKHLSIASSTALIHQSTEAWIVHTEWVFSSEFINQLKKFTGKEVVIAFIPFKHGESISSLIRSQTAGNLLDSILSFDRTTLQNPFFSKASDQIPSRLSYYLPLVNSHGTNLGALLLQLDQSAIFLNKGFFQYGAFLLLFPFLIGTLIFLLIKYMITLPIIQLSRVAKTIAVGNFSVTIPPARSQDEIGRLTSALSEMKQKIENKTTELTSLNNALFSQKRHLVKLNQELNQKNDYIASLVSTVSHELRTPMASIMGFSELLLNRKLPMEKQTQFLETIHLESQRLSTILNDFLDLQKLESREPGLVLEEINCAEFIEEVLKRFPSSIYGHHRFLKKISPNLPLIEGDQKRLIQVLMNLVSNAIKYSPRGGIVTVEARMEEKEIFVSVQDEGIGIPKEEQEKIFTKFFRVDSSDHREIGGTGLGLSICKEIIQHHGGRIWVESEEGEGTRFVFTLPLPEPAGLKSQGIERKS